MKRNRIISIVASFAALAFAVGVANTSPATKPNATVVHSVSWLTSFKEAKEVAKRTGRPILLLSMFGRIDEEMPCANARTMRATLFKDPEFRAFAEREVVPAWEMVREAPKVEIDLGDGKKIKRTVRGNAVMYLCNADGKVLDAYPGVYVKDDFFPMVRGSIAELAGKSDSEVLAWHEAKASKVMERAIRATMSKMAVESPTLDLLDIRAIEGATTEAQSTDPKKLRFLRAARRVQDMSLTPMRPRAITATAIGKSLDELTPEQAGEQILRADSKQNIGAVRDVIHLWLSSEAKLPTPMEAREPVLETILKIPYKDPYFGLRDILVPGTK